MHTMTNIEAKYRKNEEIFAEFIEEEPENISFENVEGKKWEGQSFLNRRK